MLNFIRRKSFDLYRRLETREHRLRYLFVEITRQCNLSCRHCGSDCSRSESPVSLTTDSWLKLLTDIAETISRDVCIVLTGGEPLLHPDIGRITGHLASLGMPWGMVTNGHRLSDDVLAGLVADNMSSITVSLDGPESQHNHLRNSPHSFAAVTDALSRIAQANIDNVDVVTCVHPGNVSHLDETAEILIDLGISAWRLFRIFPTGRAGRTDELNLTFEQTQAMLDWIADHRPILRSRGLSVGASCEGYLPFARDRQVRDTPFFCRAGINFGSILVDGTVTGCSNNDPSFAQGNVLENSFGHLWKTRFDVFRKRDWIQKTTCRTCPQLKRCQGGSIHLWSLAESSPRFCYLHDVQK